MSAIAIRYGRATMSSHLEMKPEPGDLDIIIAAGASGGIGASLLRLRAEYDSIARMPNSRMLVRALASMAPTRALLVKYVTERHQLSDAASPLVVQAVVERVLDVWLDPNCPSCSGVGLIGGYGSPQCVCNACNGSTKRRMFWGEEQAELERIANWLEGQMSEKIDSTQRRIQRLMRQE